MLVDGSGQITLTKDGQKLLREMTIQNPTGMSYELGMSFLRVLDLQFADVLQSCDDCQSRYDIRHPKRGRAGH